ncbi:uncharacterized protein BX663DRAFT_181643 [Cokeromyces recurvatus]|uniref:uncharacterized protein n=1 Tax=Cokeromyces recurvatus TaxID=90255 RepID=UPI00221F734B|nr:uncharacterized protein BX663DRAFT_181643 [Cokeromyces recurvatus]KAI7899742.1 hypothetical protein BX663DRAFT_181643 [Cokeromyces recurvatus]
MEPTLLWTNAGFFILNLLQIVSKKKRRLQSIIYAALFTLNPIEECWSKVKSHTKCHFLIETDQLTPRIVTACKTIIPDDCHKSRLSYYLTIISQHR